jgi:hypothetical protein
MFEVIGMLQRSVTPTILAIVHGQKVDSQAIHADSRT